MLDPRTAEAIALALGDQPHDARPLGGGCVAEVYSATVAADRVVIKVDRAAQPQLHIEGRMLEYLAQRCRLPVPRVLHAAPELLVISWIEGQSAIDAGADRHAAKLLADLHSISSDAFGLEFDTLIGSLPQPNRPMASWPEFFAERRLRYMARLASEAGRLPDRTHNRVLAAAERCGEWLGHNPRPALIHGDVWGGNVLARPGAIAGFIDPAIYYADAEVELAFIALFNCFGPAFWTRYHELRPIDPAFAELRRDVYNLYPLLVHVRLFGGGYVGQLEGVLTRLDV
jgi:fructosamine-3-kinase